MKRSFIFIILIAAAVLAGRQAGLFMRSSDSVGMWQPFSQAVFGQALADYKPIVVDVMADWCAPCLEMEKATFTDSRVRAKLGQFAAFRIDATDGLSPDAQRFMEAYEVEGVPTLLFFSAEGSEIKSLRLKGFEATAPFLTRLEAVQAQAGGGA